MAYQTEQKKALLDFLYTHSEEAFTVDELAEAMADWPSVPGKSTFHS